jgi:hypothetical protein
MGVTTALLVREGLKVFEVRPGDEFPPNGLFDILRQR